MTGVRDRRHWRPLLAVALLLAGTACAPKPEVHTLTGPTMGTVWTVRLADLPQGVTLPQLHDEIVAELDAINAEMSTFRTDSALSRFNHAEAGQRLVLPERLVAVLDAALRMAEETGGAYDPTVGPLVNLWGFGTEGRRVHAPAPADIAAAKARVGWQRLNLQGDALEQPGGVYVDLSSIAKGYAVDRVLERLIERGVSGAMVDIGGDLRVRGRRPDGQRWRIAVEQPTPGIRGVQRLLEVEDVAVVTSGTYRNYFEDQGVTFAHTIDPRTGYPVEHQTVSVTVIHANAKMADALATALGVLSPEESLAFAESRGLALLLLVREGDRVIEHTTPAFDAYLSASVAAPQH